MVAVLRLLRKARAITAIGASRDFSLNRCAASPGTPWRALRLATRISGRSAAGAVALNHAVFHPKFHIENHKLGLSNTTTRPPILARKLLMATLSGIRSSARPDSAGYALRCAVAVTRRCIAISRGETRETPRATPVRSSRYRIPVLAPEQRRLVMTKCVEDGGAPPIRRVIVYEDEAPIRPATQSASAPARGQYKKQHKSTEAHHPTLFTMTTPHPSQLVCNRYPKLPSMGEELIMSRQRSPSLSGLMLQLRQLHILIDILRKRKL